ncbi:hypothetical protein MWU75_11945 [Ornithinimicrobium sp. F0845]|uniref:hypothetical protein n=1 Tax=Ornithinimicrobium sp. F0845 TaxID=2926412 RepID=UPI001FF5A25A|nr:hypothetical protein [Ornithinimicrobium sp. F0845]MCK0112851.1 hypothetical protein [Ornithinimicrobium sp. F0845]
MPSARNASTADLPPVGPARRSLAAFAAVMTLPYLVLKIAWLSGSRVGLQDPEFGHGAGLTLLNSLTMGLDVVALVLAGVFFFRRGIRAPLWLVLPPMWIGAGLLGQILVTLPINLVWQAVSPAQPTTGEVPPIDGWVYGMVYAGFAGLGIGLLGAFAIYGWQRWGGRPLPVAGPRSRAALRAAAALAVLAGAAHLVLSDVPLSNRLVDLVISGVAALALMGLTRPGAGRVTVVAAFVGTGALAAWGTFLAVTLLVPNDLVGQASVDWATVGASLLRAVAGFAGVGALALRLRGR